MSGPYIAKKFGNGTDTLPPSIDCPDSGVMALHIAVSAASERLLSPRTVRR